MEGNRSAFETQEDLISYLSTIIAEGDVILVKASRTMKFENIVSGIQKITV